MLVNIKWINVASSIRKKNSHKICTLTKLVLFAYRSVNFENPSLQLSHRIRWDSLLRRHDVRNLSEFLIDNLIAWMNKENYRNIAFYVTLLLEFAERKCLHFSISTKMSQGICYSLFTLCCSFSLAYWFHLDNFSLKRVRKMMRYTLCDFFSFISTFHPVRLAGGNVEKGLWKITLITDSYRKGDFFTVSK